MAVLQVADLRFGYAGDTLFENVTFSLSSGDRAAIVAPNGSGKTTLLRILAGELPPDAGSIMLRGGASVGYYRQSHELSAEGDVLAAFLSGFGDATRARKELRAAEQGAADGSEEALRRLAGAADRYHLVSGDDLEHRVSVLAEHLGFQGAELERPISTLSGGERGRVRLGVVLAQRPDVLLLDEPTNHLDIDTIHWLESWLLDFRGGVLLVSHDRAFLDATSNQTFELGRRGARIYPARYSEYLTLRQGDLARENAVVQRQQSLVSKTEDFIRKNIAGQKTRQAQSRRKMLDRLEKIERPEDVWAKAERIAFRFADAERSGDMVLDAAGLTARRGGRVLFSNVQLLVRRGDRIGIVGPNGAGKTTLLRLLAGRGSPEDGGRIRRGTRLQEAMFDQHLGDVDPNLTAVDNVRQVRGDLTVEAARQYLARFRFWGDDPLRLVRGYSGGERARLALAKLLLEPRNVLFLDEPTNHLDVAAAEILEEALIGFDGTVVFVSHDRRFLENVATRIVSVRGGVARVHPGTFSDYEGESHKQSPPSVALNRPAAPPSQERKRGPERPSVAASTLPKRGAEPGRRAGRVLELEGLIARAEGELTSLREALKNAPAADWAMMSDRVTDERALTKRVDAMKKERSRLLARAS